MSTVSQPHEESRARKVAAETAHSVFVETTTLLWVFYRQLLARPARAIVPDHTRDAFFQAFCDLRTNSPKDRRWFKHHWKALQPHTANGWLALSASVMLATSGLAGLLCLTTAILTFILYSALAVAVFAGIATGTILTTLSLTMVVAATMAAAGAASLGWAYTVVETTHTTVSWTNARVIQPALQWLQSSSPRQTISNNSRSPRSASPRQTVSKPTTEPASLHAVDNTPATSSESTVTGYTTLQNGSGPGPQGNEDLGELLSKSIAGKDATASVAYSAPYTGAGEGGLGYPEAKGTVYGAED
ncbi:hypothetical protein WJX73_008109 [Symbiochloris irregularis]|uniref:Uncharacterized protein n=1 Tax=Symbiochloris irregularis TaxID=706552 RepID=A0AAW1P1R0_9CHLO